MQRRRQHKNHDVVWRSGAECRWMFLFASTQLQQDFTVVAWCVSLNSEDLKVIANNQKIIFALLLCRWENKTKKKAAGVGEMNNKSSTD